MSTSNTTVYHSGKLAIGDIGYALHLFADYYRTVQAAVKEFVTNAVEARASQVVIHLYVAGTKPFLSFTDNGCGMDPAALKRVAEGICDSLKRGQTGFTGRHGIAMVTAAKRLGAEMLLVTSRLPNQERAYTLVFPLTGKSIEYHIYEEPQNQLPQGGTIVKLVGFSEKDKKSLAATLAPHSTGGNSRLAQYLGGAFRTQILAKQITIRLQRRGGRGQGDEYVQPISYSGVPVDLAPVKTGFGEIHFQLFCRTGAARGERGISIQHHVVSIIEDLAREIPADFGREPWTKFEGQISAPWLERSGGGVATRHKTYLAFRQALVRLEPKLHEFHRRLVEETIDVGDVTTLREAFRRVLGGESLTFENLRMPKPSVITQTGDGREVVMSRANLGGTRQSSGEGTAVKRQPYAVPAPERSPILTTKPVPKPGLVSTRRVSQLVWLLGLFQPEKQSLYYEMAQGVICVNTGHPNYLRFVDTESYEGRRVTKPLLKLLWMAMVTCRVLVDLNMPLEEGFETKEREDQLGLLVGRVSALLLSAGRSKS